MVRGRLGTRIKAFPRALKAVIFSYIVWKGRFHGKVLGSHRQKNVTASRYHLLNCGLIFRIKNGIYFTIYTCFCARYPTGFNITRSYSEASFVACNRQVSSGRVWAKLQKVSPQPSHFGGVTRDVGNRQTKGQPPKKSHCQGFAS